MRIRLAFALSLCNLAACHPVPKPEPSAQFIPAPPIKSGAMHLYPGDEAPILQSRGGDCRKPGVCTVYKATYWGHRKWQPLQNADTGSLALLNLTTPVGSAYSRALFTDVSKGTDRDSIMVNTIASQPIEAHVFDGLRIGLSKADAVTYFTAYAVEPSPTVDARRIADKAYLSTIDADIVIANKKAWLLQRRSDGSANLIDLFSVPRGPVLCLPGLILDTAGTWIGSPEVALSPDAFISALKITPSYEAHKKQLLQSCATKPT